MSQDSILKRKSFELAIRIVNLYKYLKEKRNEYIVSQQILKSGTSIGSLIREAEFAESRNDFAHKLYIALKEANETIYWLDLLFATGYIDKNIYESMHSDGITILKMLVSSIKTIKTKEVSSK
jgi:four helix bundle protein